MIQVGHTNHLLCRRMIDSVESSEQRKEQRHQKRDRGCKLCAKEVIYVRTRGQFPLQKGCLGGRRKGPIEASCPRGPEMTKLEPCNKAVTISATGVSIAIGIYPPTYVGSYAVSSDWHDAFPSQTMDGTHPSNLHPTSGFEKQKHSPPKVPIPRRMWGSRCDLSRKGCIET